MLGLITLKINLLTDSVPLKSDAFRIFSQLFEVIDDKLVLSLYFRGLTEVNFRKNAFCLAEKLAELLETANTESSF
ncbi:hypothetical protein L596_024942 [Steinernema carpocapsae]|uniref:Uncharacterized protein n=1 Tax=Steinernema carpocapsae TaxID=34508 RepID=A0A4U5M762_STECR|nr:hypothetical protein L596_024942 [Steinernema carpocapsae]